MSRTIKDLPYELWQKHVSYYDCNRVQIKYMKWATETKTALKRSVRRSANDSLKQIGEDYDESHIISCRKPNSDWKIW